MNRLILSFLSMALVVMLAGCTTEPGNESSDMESEATPSTDTQDAVQNIDQGIRPAPRDESSASENDVAEGTDDQMIDITVSVGGTSFQAQLYDNETTQALISQFPLTVTMGELNGNEKFYYLPNALPTNAFRPDTISAGDLMLYGSDCLVLFYEGFSSPYRYTALGSVNDTAGLTEALGGGSVEVSFEVA